MLKNPTPSPRRPKTPSKRSHRKLASFPRLLFALTGFSLAVVVFVAALWLETRPDVEVDSKHELLSSQAVSVEPKVRPFRRS